MSDMWLAFYFCENSRPVYQNGLSIAQASLYRKLQQYAKGTNCQLWTLLWTLLSEYLHVSGSDHKLS